MIKWKHSSSKGLIRDPQKLYVFHKFAMMQKHFALIPALFLLICLQTSAQSLKTLIPDDVAGPVTQAETDRYDVYYPYFKIPLNNNKKDMTWDLSPFIHSLIYMYEINHDIKYMDYAIKCCDRIQDARRTVDVDYVTQRTIPGWPYFDIQFPDSTGKPAIYNNVVGNGAIIRAMSRVARVIRRDSLDESYQIKAQSYILSCTETINSFIDHTEWYDPITKLFHFPDNTRHDDCLPGVRGLTSAFNRQLLMAAGMLNVVKYYEFTGEEAALRSKFTGVVESVAHYFWNSVTTHGSGESTYYLWMYREEGKNGSAPRMEDIEHGGYDIKCIVQIHEDLGIATGPQLSFLGNTLMEHAQYNPQAHAFADKIDGSDKYDDPMGQREGSLRWLALSDWDERVFANAGWQLTNGVELRKALPYAEFLYYKAKYYGTEPALSGQSYPVVPAKAEIRISPNPARDWINIALSFDKEQIDNIRIIDPVSGRVCRTLSKDLPAQSKQDISLDVSGLTEGVYIIVIQTNDGLISQKFIKH